ncbi:hypothetical protein SDC9_123907 [bioreactor metagenome]|uniref:histidine kinase n=1 Tax=bioreactor metagenome TaxID=1076179 RepID=A0A645CJ28_9ZZZZ
MEAERNRQRLILKAAACQGQIRRMLEDFREIFSGGYRAFFRGDIPFGEGLSELFRAVHTFKGDFSQYGFMDASTHLHVFEDRLLELLRKGPSATMYQVEQAMEDARPDEMLEADLQVINEVWGAGYLEGSEMVSIPKARLSELEACLREGSAGPEEAAALVGSLKLKNLKELLRQYQDYLDYLAGRLMKPSPVFLLEGDDVAVDPDVWADLLQALVHVFRNSMDHGLEGEEERLEAGKPLRGLIRCTVTRTDEGRFCLCVSDDGRGLDPEQLKATAVLMGHASREALDQMCERELCGLIFVDGLSTKCSADALSGRGVGMPAVRSACLRLGGSLEVISTPGMGTTLRFELPEAPSYTEVQQA